MILKAGVKRLEKRQDLSLNRIICILSDMLESASGSISISLEVWWHE
jgi:hypothetical protein